MKKEIEKKKFEVKMRQHPDGSLEKAIFIDGEKLDYSIDISAYMEARKMGPMFKIAVQKDIEKHFTESISEILGRRVTMEELKKAFEEAHKQGFSLI